MPGLPRRATVAIVAVRLTLALPFGLLSLAPLSSAQAFYPDDVHIPVFRSELGAKFDAQGQEWVILGLREPDVIGQTAPEMHFDGAANPTQMCDRWKDGPSKFLTETARTAVEAFRRDKKDPPGTDRVAIFRQQALVNFGRYLHAIQDFYSHANWVELAVAQGGSPGVAPILDGCDAAKLPSALATGYFDPKFPPDFCGPPGAPRPPAGLGFTYCHGPSDPHTLESVQSVATWLQGLQNTQPSSPTTGSPCWKDYTGTLDHALMIAKDLAKSFHGCETLPGSSDTYYAVAKQLATRATADTWPVLHDTVVQEFTKQASLFPNRDPECLFTALVKGTDPACPKATMFKGTSADALGLAYGLRAIDVPKERIGTWEVRAFQAEIGLDPVTGKVVTGSLTVDLFDQATFDQGGLYRYTLNASAVERSTMSGDVGTVKFADPIIYYQTPPFEPELERRVPDLSYTFSDAGQFVLCEGFTATADPATQRQECLATPIAVLDPVTGVPPSA